MYPLIILGAGASFDYFDREQHLNGPIRETDLLLYRPPLLKNLFDPNRFSPFLNKYSDAAALAADADGVEDFEAYLTRVQDHLAPNNNDRYKQLIALRYYLCELFNQITQKYYRPKNYYRKIITNIKDYGGKACFVNFNYDLLLETNLPNIRSSEYIDSYIADKIKVIKIHGAYNWFYETKSFQGEKPDSSALDIFYMYAKNFVEFGNSGRQDIPIVIDNTNTNLKWDYKRAVEHQKGADFYLPALAVPVTTKADYICPDNHIKELETALENIDRVLIIGWKANDKPLVNLLKTRIKKPTPVTVVSMTSSTEVIEKLETNTYLTFNPLQKGFTDFVKSGELDKFFTN
jgi:hypothetical protein